MARIKPSALIADISGRIGGSVFQRNQGGLSLRNQSGKINSNTQRSNLHRVGLSTVMGEWTRLTDQQRLLWQTYAGYLGKKQRKSDSLIVNGHQLFIAVNSIRYDLQSVNAIFDPYLQTTPILAPLPLPINIISITTPGDTVRVNFDRATVEDEDVIILFMSRPLSGSQMSAYQKLTLMLVGTLSQDNMDVTDYYTSVYGRPLDIDEYCQTEVAVWNIDSGNYSSYSVARIKAL